MVFGNHFHDKSFQSNTLIQGSILHLLCKFFQDIYHKRFGKLLHNIDYLSILYIHLHFYYILCIFLRNLYSYIPGHTLFQNALHQSRGLKYHHNSLHHHNFVEGNIDMKKCNCYQSYNSLFYIWNNGHYPRIHIQLGNLHNNKNL